MQKPKMFFKNNGEREKRKEKRRKEKKKGSLMSASPAVRGA